MSTMMRALGLSVRNFAGLRDGAYRFERSRGQAAQSVAIIGKRAAGKTSALQALLMAKELTGPYAQPPSLLARARQAGRPVSLELWLAVGDGAGGAEQRVLFEQGGSEPIREVPPAVVSLAVPTYLKQDAAPREVVEPVSSLDPDATAAIPVHVALGHAIPFAGDRSEVHLRELASRSPPARDDRPAGPDGTVVAPQQVLLETLASGSFRDALAPVVVPQLTVADYADLRARLVVFGEDHVPSLRHHGVLSVAAKEALERAFRGRFEADAVLRGRFEATIRERVRHHRRGNS